MRRTKAGVIKLDPEKCKHPAEEQYPLNNGNYVCRLCGTTLVASR